MRFRLYLDVSYKAQEGVELPDATRFHATLARALKKFATSPHLTKGLKGIEVDQVGVGLAPVDPATPTPRDAVKAANGGG